MIRFCTLACVIVLIAFPCTPAAEIDFDLLRRYRPADLDDCLEQHRDRLFFESIHNYAYIDHASDDAYMLGHLYENGIGTRVDIAKAALWYGRAIMAENQFGNSRQMAEEALRRLEMTGRLPVAEAEPAAQEVEAAGLPAREKLRLGIRFHYGLCAEMDFEKARFWQLRAAEEGDAAARDMAGNNYRYGAFGYPKDEELAETYLSRDALPQPTPAQVEEGAAAAIAEAVSNPAALQSLPDYAQEIFLSGLACYRGDGDVAQEYFLAGLNFTEAAAFGLKEAECHFLLGDIQEKGLCGEANYYGAGKSYRIAAEYGHTEAMLRLARLHEEGLGVRQSAAEAAKWRAAAGDRPISY